MKKIFITSLLALTTGTVFSQTYPMPVLPNRPVTLNPVNDTLWVLRNSQYEKAIERSKKLTLCDSSLSLTNDKVKKLEGIFTEKNGIISAKDSLYRHYLELWQVTDKKLEAKEKETVKLKKRVKVFAIGGTAATILGFVIGLIL